MRSTIHFGALFVTAVLLGAAGRLSASDQGGAIAAERAATERAAAESTTAPERTAAVARPATPAVSSGSSALGIDGSATLWSPAENAWDFNAPATIPSFGPMPQEVEQVLRRSR